MVYKMQKWKGVEIAHCGKIQFYVQKFNIEDWLSNLLIWILDQKLGFFVVK